jgi:hypothetical protein
MVAQIFIDAKVDDTDRKLCRWVGQLVDPTRAASPFGRANTSDVSRIAAGELLHSRALSS